MNRIFLAILSIVITLITNAQSIDVSQNIKGVVYDVESSRTLEGVTVSLQPGNQVVLSDKNGSFYFKGISVGKYNLNFSISGFESHELTGLELTAGKELDVSVNMSISIRLLNGIVMNSSADKKARNEFAVTSSRSFSLQDAKLYPASFSDPARMVTNFAGVTNSNDGTNGIVVRGNTPKGVLWKLNGIEIPNPNHFSLQGSSAGAVSMLSTNVVGNSDFYTAAFPAEFGNATSAVFDLNFRKGNKDKNEYAFSVGGLGLEASIEGPLSKKKQSSYLVNYRYSTLALIGKVMDLNGQLPVYQDVSFNFNFITPHAGTINIFGLAGLNNVAQEAKKDTVKWIKENELNSNMSLDNKLGVLGIDHQLSLSKNTYIKTVASFSATNSSSKLDTLNPATDYKAFRVGSFDFDDNAIRLSSYLNTRLNPSNILRVGFIAQQLKIDYKSDYYDDVEQRNKTIFADKGDSYFYQAYAQWKYRPTSKITFNLGLHSTLLTLNNKSTVEPRMSFNYKANKGQSFSFSSGLHSRIEALAVYYFEDVPTGSPNTNPNKNLATPKAFHNVLGYERKIASIKSRLKIEVYHQYHFDIAVEKDSNSGFSTINMEQVFELRDKKPLVSNGKGQNYGIDISLEHPVYKGLYFMANVSVFNSVYTNYAGKEFNTRYNRNFSSNINLGKEWAGSKRKNRTTGANMRLVAMGALRENLIDLPLSIASGKEEYVRNRYFASQSDPYLRMDLSIFIRTNHKKSTNTLSIEIQNATSNINTGDRYFDKRTSSVKQSDQLGVFPNISYKIQF